MHSDIYGPFGRMEEEPKKNPHVPVGGQLTLRMKVNGVELEIQGEAATVNAQYDKVKNDLPELNKLLVESTGAFADKLAESMLKMLK